MLIRRVVWQPHEPIQGEPRILGNGVENQPLWNNNIVDCNHPSAEPMETINRFAWPANFRGQF